MSPLRVGVIGAGRVGAVLAAALRRRGHVIVSVAGESDASQGRAAALLPGVPIAKPTAVARGCDVLLLTVPDDMLDNVVTQLVGQWRDPRRPVRRAHQRQPRPAGPRAGHRGWAPARWRCTRR